MFSHITLGSRDLERSEKFYNAVLLPIGLKQREVVPDGGPEARCWIHPDKILPRFLLFQPYDGEVATAGNGTMVAFLAPDPKSVDLAYAAGLKEGGLDAGKPGPRAHYGEGYYGAYLFDPDGNKIHLACRGDLPNQDL